MATYTRDYNDTLESLAHGAIRASVRELESRDRLTLAMREALRNGADINDLSGTTGLRIDEIRRRTQGALHVLSDLELLAG